MSATYLELDNSPRLRLRPPPSEAPTNVDPAWPEAPREAELHGLHELRVEEGYWEVADEDGSVVRVEALSLVKIRRFARHGLRLVYRRHHRRLW